MLGPARNRRPDTSRGPALRPACAPHPLSTEKASPALPVNPARRGTTGRKESLVTCQSSSLAQPLRAQALESKRLGWILAAPSSSRVLLGKIPISLGVRKAEVTSAPSSRLMGLLWRLTRSKRAKPSDQRPESAGAHKCWRLLFTSSSSPFTAPHTARARAGGFPSPHLPDFPRLSSPPSLPPSPPAFSPTRRPTGPAASLCLSSPANFSCTFWGSARALPWESLLSPELPAAGGPSARLSRQPNMTRALSGTLDSERFRVSVPPDGGCREATAEIGHCLLREQMSW